MNHCHHELYTSEQHFNFNSIPDPDTYAPFLDHGKVKIVSNMDCRANQDIGRYVTNTTICTDPDRQFACSVRFFFLSSPKNQSSFLKNNLNLILG